MWRRRFSLRLRQDEPGDARAAGLWRTRATRCGRWGRHRLVARRSGWPLWASNPEAGFFGVVGTNSRSNPNAVDTILTNTIYTNVALRPDGNPGGRPRRTRAGVGSRLEGTALVPDRPKAAHPNSRFTAPASQCPSIAPNWETPRVAPRRRDLGGRRRTGAARDPKFPAGSTGSSWGDHRLKSTAAQQAAP